MADKLQQIIDALEPRIREAFLQSIADITSAAKLSAVIGHLEAGNIEAALVALNLREEFFGPLDDAIRRAYLEGGASMLAGLPALASPFQDGAAVAVRFNGRHERAERAARELSSKLITWVVEDQKEAARLVIGTGIREGWNPRKTALDIVGRVNRATKRREGGIIGLRKDQTDVRLKIEAAMQTPDGIRSLLVKDAKSGEWKPAYKAINKATMNRLIRAHARGEPLAKADIDLSLRQITNGMLEDRGDMIARTESIGSLNAGREEGVRQLIDGGHMRTDQVTMVWDASGDSRTRDDHRAMDGQRRPLGQPFVAPSGSRMMHPGDTSLGASGADTINCRCVLRADMDFISGLK